MIGLFLQATLGAIGPQTLPPAGCAAFLWSREATPSLVAMAASEPGTLTLQLNGKVLVLPRTTVEGEAKRGLSALSRYVSGPVSATLALSVTERPDLIDGALVSDATVTVEQPGHDTIVVPAGGMIGCAPATLGTH